ncbi:MAG: 2'-5' RNA ligase family protein [Bryobacteraceae bacterium]
MLEYSCDGTGHSGDTGLNSFALVTYLPDPLKAYLDDLRVSLETDPLPPRAHLTVLPPRQIASGASVAQATAEIAAKLRSWPAFEVVIGGIGIFPGTRVIYLEIEEGASDLRQMHVDLNGGVLFADERFVFHPHITLAQRLDPAQADSLARLAADIWASYTGPRRFFVEQFTFVQNTVDRGWRDLSAHQLSQVSVARL